jgi:hypothetical protein
MFICFHCSPRVEQVREEAAASERRALGEVSRVRRELDLEKEGWQAQVTAKLEAEFKIREKEVKKLTVVFEYYSALETYSRI